ncbi:hypothetical protein CBD41_09710 [bacterium TMED181]|nr:hypothetical protein [Planctomycetota bacterium]OUW42155.1 MAG: hypothetical protein CBD41_09710 [bacterium TMED181]
MPLWMTERQSPDLDSETLRDTILCCLKDRRNEWPSTSWTGRLLGGFERNLQFSGWPFPHQGAAADAEERPEAEPENADL